MVNDISIITGIVAVFIAVGVFLPVLDDGYNNVITSSNDIAAFEASLSNATGQLGNKEIDPTFLNPLGSLSIFDIMFSVLLMFFWTFGALPVWLDLIFLVFRVTLILIIARNLWVGGGG